MVVNRRSKLHVRFITTSNTFWSVVEFEFLIDTPQALTHNIDQQYAPTTFKFLHILSNRLLWDNIKITIGRNITMIKLKLKNIPKYFNHFNQYIVSIF